MVRCLPCTVGYHLECWDRQDNGDCHCTADAPVAFIGNNATETEQEKKEHGGQIKFAKDVTDLESTGRKRAARLYPIPKEGEPGYPMSCEWQGLNLAGGGILPIVGCLGGMAQHIHHGPDKNTLSNFVGNVHRICTQCHNRWHTVNDEFYSGERPAGDTPYLPPGEYHPHNGMAKATPEDMAASEMAWATSTAKSFLTDRLIDLTK